MAMLHVWLSKVLKLGMYVVCIVGRSLPPSNSLEMSRFMREKNPLPSSPNFIYVYFEMFF